MLWIIAIVGFLVSFASKLLADAFLTARVALLGSFAGLQHAENSGVAFSITFAGPLQTVLIAAALVLLIWASLRAQTRWSKIAFGLILGGAAGNIADRILDGKVTDFFQVSTFPIFNVADSVITVGVALLLIESFAQWKAKER